MLLLHVSPTRRSSDLRSRGGNARGAGEGNGRGGVDVRRGGRTQQAAEHHVDVHRVSDIVDIDLAGADAGGRSEEHTSELQSLRHLVCRLLLEKTKEVE